MQKWELVVVKSIVVACRHPDDTCVDEKVLSESIHPAPRSRSPRQTHQIRLVGEVEVLMSSLAGLAKPVCHVSIYLRLRPVSASIRNSVHSGHQLVTLMRNAALVFAADLVEKNWLKPFLIVNRLRLSIASSRFRLTLESKVHHQCDTRKVM